MELIWKIFFILSLSTCIFEEVICQSQSESTSNFSQEEVNTDQLWLSLLSNYNSRISSTKLLSLTLNIKPIKIIKVDVENGIVTLDVWLTRYWADSRLSWNPEDTGIRVMRIKPNYIHVPQIDLYYGMTTNLMAETDVVVYYTGIIYQVLPIRTEVFCGLPAIPFQNTVCNMTFGSWTKDDSVLNITTDRYEYEIDPVGKEIGMCRIDSARGRVKTNVYPCCPGESYSDLLVFLQISCYRSRPSASQALSQYRVLKHADNESDFEKLSLPMVVAPFLVLLIFLLPPRATDRIFLGAIVFLYLLLITICGVPTAEDQSFIRISIWVTVTATFASLVSCRLINFTGVFSYGTGNDTNEQNDLSRKRRLAFMVDGLMFAASAVVLGIAAAVVRA